MRTVLEFYYSVVDTFLNDKGCEFYYFLFEFSLISHPSCISRIALNIKFEFEVAAEQRLGDVNIFGPVNGDFRTL